jgi:hypothetical protein
MKEETTFENIEYVARMEGREDSTQFWLNLLQKSNSIIPQVLLSYVARKYHV